MSKKQIVRKVISANYKDRSSEFKWLVRDEDKGLDTVVAVKSLEAKGVTFGQSRLETGFGCSMVAFADEVVLGESEATKVGLRFNGADFVNRVTNKVVEAVSSLSLAADGSMTAVV